VFGCRAGQNRQSDVVMGYFAARRRLKETDHGTYSWFYCLWMNSFHRTTCGHVCRWRAPYGFVAEGRCPEHD
jgi:hypothetical protein